MNAFRERINSLAWSKSGSVVLKAALAVLAGVIIYSKWYEQRPLEVHLRDIFRESGFKVPDYVSDLEGEKGFVDFHGDFSASVSFTVRPEDVAEFMDLPAKYWKSPKSFQPLEVDGMCGKFRVPAGAFMTDEWVSSDYNCKYGVDRKNNRIYFYRSST